MRLDKLLSTLHYGSRKEIKEAAKDGRILVNGITQKDASVVVNEQMDQIHFDQQPVFYKSSLTLMMNKPKGVVSANQDGNYPTVLDLVEEKYARLNLSIAGRLDLDTTGLLILTNDGALLHEIISPKSEIWKTYVAELKYPANLLDKISQGVSILDGKNEPYLTKPAMLRKISEKTVEIAIHEGKFHQVKRMFEAVGNEVESLSRISIGELKLPTGLLEGQVCELKESDLLQLFSGKIPHL